MFEYAGDGQKTKTKQLIFEQRIWSPYFQEGHENGNAFYGTKGVMILGKKDGWQVTLEGNKPGPSGRGTFSLPHHHQNFLDCIRSGARPNADIEIGHLTASLCHLGNIATRVGQGLAVLCADQLSQLVHIGVDQRTKGHHVRGHEDGVRLLVGVANAYPDSARAYTLLKKQYSTPEQSAKTVTACESLVKLKPTDPAAQVLLGGAYADVGRVQEAIACFQEAIALDPNCFDAHLGLGRAHFDRGRYGEAVACEPSRFLDELPKELLDWRGADAEADQARTRERAGANLARLKELFG